MKAWMRNHHFHQDGQQGGVQKLLKITLVQMIGKITEVAKEI